MADDPPVQKTGLTPRSALYTDSRALQARESFFTVKPFSNTKYTKVTKACPARVEGENACKISAFSRFVYLVSFVFRLFPGNYGSASLPKLTDHPRDQTDLPEVIGGDVEDAPVFDRGDELVPRQDDV